MVFLSILPINWWGFEKGREGAKREAGREARGGKGTLTGPGPVN